MSIEIEVVVTGPPGPVGPHPTLTVGDVITGTPDAEFVDDGQDGYELNLTLPPGPELSIGTVDTGATADAEVTGNPYDGYVLDLTLPPVGANGVDAAAIQDDAVTSDKIANGTILNEDIAADADIDPTKIAGTALTSESTGIFNVLDYGAVGDGVTDDTDAIQAAIDAAVATGGTVVVPAGVFKISDALTVTDTATITGTGTIHQVTAATYGFDVTGGGVSIDGLTLLGPNSSPVCQDGEDAVHVFGPSAAAMLNGIAVRGLTIRGWGMYGVLLKWVDGFSVEGCEISGIGYAGIATWSTVNGLIATNRIDGIGPGQSGNMYGIKLARWETDSLVTDPQSSDTVITGNVLSNIAWEGIDTHGGQRLTISGNILNDCGRAIAIVGSDDSTNTTMWAPKDVAVTGNVIESQHADGTLSEGISFAGAFGALESDPAVDYATGVIANNLIRGHGVQDSVHSGGIRCRNTEGLVISGNVIEQPSPHGICLYYDNRGFSVTGNTVVDAWSSVIDTASVVALRSNNNKGLIAGNVLRRGSKTATYVNVNGLYNPVLAADGTAVEVGMNDFAAATYPMYHVGLGYGCTTSLIAHLSSPHQLRLAGSESEPGYSFSSDPNTGFYCMDPGQIGVAANGIRRIRFTSEGILLEDGNSISMRGSSGGCLAVGPSQKLGFWGATPVVQPAANPDTSGASLGDLEAEVNQLKALLRSIGLMGT